MLKMLFPHVLVKQTVDHVVDNYVRDNVCEPAVGSIVYCDLAFGSSEHSGVYLGAGEIMQLNRRGEIERVSPEEFVSNTTALSIYVSCRGAEPVGNIEVAERAKHYEKVIVARDYNVILDNCHQFSAACLTGDPENATNFLWMLKHDCEKYYSADSWRVWERPWCFERDSNNQPSNDSEIDEALARKNKQYRELSKLSVTLSDEMYEHMDRCPVDGPFLDSRTTAWEKKLAIIEKRLDGVSSTMDELEREINELERQRAG